jgi:hypothetical protein
MAFSEWVNASGEATTWVSSNEMPAWWIPLVPGTSARAGWADWANADGEIVYWRNASQQRVRWGWPHACVLVMATRIGQIKEQMLRPGDVFWCDADLYSETSFDYGFGRAGAPVFGWMQLVPQSTPLTILSHQALPWYDFQPPRRRTVF